MKIIIIFIVTSMVFFFNACTNEKNNKAEVQKHEIPSESENFDWLLGNWKRTNEKEDRETFEIWKKRSASEYIGLGFTLQNEDTIKQEKIKLIKLNAKWILEVKVIDEESVIFNLTSFSIDEFTFENKVIDFPNTIKYWKNGDKLNAIVSGGEMEIPFVFEEIPAKNMRE